MSIVFSKDPLFMLEIDNKLGCFHFTNYNHFVSQGAIELNVLRDAFSSIAIELTFVILGHGFKKAGSVLYDICAPGTRTF